MRTLDKYNPQKNPSGLIGMTMACFHVVGGDFKDIARLLKAAGLYADTMAARQVIGLPQQSFEEWGNEHNLKLDYELYYQVNEETNLYE